jgi:hypothetical protein
MASTIKCCRRGGTIILSQLRIADIINTNSVVDYIFKRQNEDGGYTFCRGTASNAQDTYYALKILEILNVKSCNTERTVLFLQGLQHEDGGFDSVKAAFYVIQSLSQLGSSPTRPTNPLIHSFEVILRGLEHPSTYVEIVSEIENLHLAVELLRNLNFPIDAEKVTKQISNLRNSDRSFGSRRHSRIASTYHALEILRVLNHDNESLKETLRWIRRCEVPSGGLVSSPDVATSYLEDTYFGVKTLEILNERLRYPQETLKYIVKFQNPNGGFRRSVFLGISDLESTYQAISCIKAIISSRGY